MQQSYQEPAKTIPVLDSVDVLVVGGGTAGFAAAVAAGRNGARTLLIERNGVIGGIATAGLMCAWASFGRLWDGLGEQVITGIPWEIHRRIIENGGGVPAAMVRETATYKMAFDVEVFKRTAFQMLREAGVEILFHTMACDPIMEGDMIKGLIIENKSGRQAVYAKQVIDATGDADVCWRAGAECTDRDCKNTLCFRVGGCDLQKCYDYLASWYATHRSQDPSGGAWDMIRLNWERDYFITVCGGLNAPFAWEPFLPIIEQAITDGYFARDALNHQITSRQRQGKEDLWGFDMQGMEGRRGTDIVNSYGLLAVFKGTDAREVSKYHVLGHEQNMIFFERIMKRFPGFEKSYMMEIGADFGIRASRTVRTKRPSISLGDFDAGARFADSVGRASQWWAQKNRGVSPVRAIDVPYGLLVPEGLRNVHLVGRMVSWHLRGMTPCMVMGEAGGTAAALAARKGIASDELDIKEVQRTLKENKVNIGF